MLYHHSCERCHLPISEARLNNPPVVCDSCGHVVSRAENPQENLETSYLKAIVVLSIFIVMGFIQVATWGDHALTVVPLKVGEWLGWNSAEDQEKLAVIAVELKKYDLAERLYTERARADLSLAPRLGKFQMARARFQEAANTFRHHLRLYPDDLDSRYLFARSLGESGQIDEAIPQYEYLLKVKPSVVQVTLVQNYVKHLLAANRLDEAKRVIETVQRRGGETVSQFMATELKTIVERMRSRG